MKHASTIATIGLLLSAFCAAPLLAGTATPLPEDCDGPATHYFAPPTTDLSTENCGQPVPPHSEN